MLQCAKHILSDLTNQTKTHFVKFLYRKTTKTSPSFNLTCRTLTWRVEAVLSKPKTLNVYSSLENRITNTQTLQDAPQKSLAEFTHTLERVAHVNLFGDLGSSEAHRREQLCSWDPDSAAFAFFLFVCSLRVCMMSLHTAAWSQTLMRSVFMHSSPAL